MNFKLQILNNSHLLNKLKYFIAIFIIQSVSTALAQETDSVKYKTEEIKVFSNKIITNKFDAPIKIQLINREEINNKNGENLSDVLQLGGNVFIKSYGGSNSLSTISMNGLGAEQTLVLLNGFKMNSYQNSQIDLTSIGKDNIDRIEILNNGSSSIYGSQAIGGVVNIVTNNNRTKDLTLKLNGQAGSYRQRKIYLGVNKNMNNFNVDLNYSRESSENDYEYYFNNGIVKLLKHRDNSSYELSNYSATFDYKNGSNISLNLYGSYTDQLRYIPGIETGSAPSNSSQLDRNFNNVLSFENIISEHTSFRSQINFQNNLTNYDDRLLTNSYYKNIVLSNTSQINFIKNNFELVAGYQLDYASLKSNEVDNDARRIQPGMFVVSEISVKGLLRIFPSVRYDYISDIDRNVVSGKFGMNLKPFSRINLNFKTSIGNNFAAPTFNELYWKDLGNKNLKPESSLNYDAGIIYGFNLFSDNSLEVTYTFIDAKDKIVWAPNSSGFWTPSNIGRSASNVLLLNAVMNKKLGNDLSAGINLNYCFTGSVKKSADYPGDRSFDKQIFYIPEQLIKIGSSLKYKGTGVNLFYTYTGRRFTDFENINYLPAVNLLEGNIYRDIAIDRINMQLKLEVNNILNEDYQVISGYPVPLRNYKLILSLNY